MSLKKIKINRVRKGLEIWFINEWKVTRAWLNQIASPEFIVTLVFLECPLASIIFIHSFLMTARPQVELWKSF